MNMKRRWNLDVEAAITVAYVYGLVLWLGGPLFYDYVTHVLMELTVPDVPLIRYVVCAVVGARMLQIVPSFYRKLIEQQNTLREKRIRGIVNSD